MCFVLTCRDSQFESEMWRTPGLTQLHGLSVVLPQEQVHYSLCSFSTLEWEVEANGPSSEWLGRPGMPAL